MRHQRLAARFDAAVLDDYAPAAVLIRSHRKADGSVATERLQGAELHAHLRAALSLSQARGDVYRLSDVRLSALDDGRIEVRARRHSELFCTTDPDYRLLLERTAGGAFEIIEEHITTGSGVCPDRDPAPLIDAVVAQLQPRLPISADDETRLDAVRGGDASLTYELTLVRLGASDVDVGQLQTALSSMGRGQACMRPDLRPLLDRGATVVFAYRWKDGLPFFEATVSEGDCP